MRSFVEKMRGLLGNSTPKYDPNPLYEAIVAQARTPDLFRAGYEIPNTLDGRFDSLSLHLHLVIRRFGEIEGFETQIQKLLNRFFTDMDQSVREIGVGDMSVGKHVTKMGKAYYGRVLGYEETMHNPEALAAKVRLNIFGIKDDEPNEDQQNKELQDMTDQSFRLAAYVMSQAEHINAQEPEVIIQGKLNFLAP